MISKELLSEVLQIENILEYRLSVNTLWVTDAKSHCGAMSYNIYELAHKCKEWALTKDFSIKSTYDFTHTCFASIYGLQRGTYYNTEAYSEPEAIFKACQWVLDNKETK